VRKKFRDLLHSYRVESFKMTHNNEHLEEITKDILAFTQDALNNAYEYHFHTPGPDPQRVETFNMIKNYTLEAILPPVIEKVMRRVMVLEKQHESIVTLIDNLLQSLSDEEDGVASKDRSAV
jgi:hypothetical protein